MTWTLSTTGRAACIDGGLNAAIATGTTETYPYVLITTTGGGTDLLKIDPCMWSIQCMKQHPLLHRRKFIHIINIFQRESPDYLVIC